MGTSKKLHVKLAKMAAPLTLPTGPIPGRADMPSIEKFLRDGLDPVHAVYVFMQNITSHFSEAASELPEMKRFAKIIAKAEDEYMPIGPPMSPLTKSHFTCWAFYDLRFDGTDTLAACLIQASDLIGMNADQLDALKKLAASRMGVYRHVGFEGRYIRLRELVTDAEHVCHNTSGYRGRTGDLWYVRLVPPLLAELGNYDVAFTTPYVLLETTEEDWLQFFRRNLSQSRRFGNGTEGLHRFLKYGPDLHYWNEFVFKGYCNHESRAIYLTGIPDLEATLPHA